MSFRDADYGPTGKKVNCDSWATYEEKGSSDTAVLCHGHGLWEGKWYHPCPSRYDCAKATHEKEKEKEKRYLPVMNPPARTRSGSVIFSTKDPYRPPPSLSRLPTYRRHEGAERQKPESYIEGGPVLVIPPQDYPEVMRTPYAYPAHPAAEPLTPVFLPASRKEVFPRLLLNMLQGAMGAGAQHLMEYMRHVDIFGKMRDPDQ